MSILSRRLLLGTETLPPERINAGPLALDFRSYDWGDAAERVAGAVVDTIAKELSPKVPEPPPPPPPPPPPWHERRLTTVGGRVITNGHALAGLLAGVVLVVVVARRRRK